MSSASSDSEGVVKGRRWPRLRKVALVLISVALLLAGYNFLAGRLVDRWTASVPRDAETGIMIGAEDYFLGPEDATAAVLLVHGFVGAGNNFGELPERLAAKGYRVRVMRLPGHGTSPRDFAATSADELVDAVKAEALALKEKHAKVYLIGHSMGGSLVTLASAAVPVDGLILGAPYFGVSYEWYYILPAEVWSKMTGAYIKWVPKADPFIRVNRTEVRDQILSYYWIPSQGSKTLMELGASASSPELLEQVSAPVLLIHSRNDRAASPEAAATAVETMRSESKQTLWLTKSDHHIFWDYEREEVITAIIQFLERESAAKT